MTTFLLDGPAPRPLHKPAAVEIGGNGGSSGASNGGADTAWSEFTVALKADAVQVWHVVLGQPLLALALGSMVLVLLGGLVRRPLPFVGGFMRLLGNVGLMLALLALVLRVAGYSGGIGFHFGSIDFGGGSGQEQTVSGKVTRIPMDDDGHFWVKAEINGVPRRFLVDTGATLTTLSPEAAQAAGLANDGGRQVRLNTANGTTIGDVVRIRELRIGNVIARDTEAVVAPGLAGTNVLGMNFMSRLAGWRVEGHTMILVPHHPQASPTPQETE